MTGRSGTYSSAKASLPAAPSVWLHTHFPPDSQTQDRLPHLPLLLTQHGPGASTHPQGAAGESGPQRGKGQTVFTRGCFIRAGKERLRVRALLLKRQAGRREHPPRCPHAALGLKNKGTAPANVRAALGERPPSSATAISQPVSWASCDPEAASRERRPVPLLSSSPTLWPQLQRTAAAPAPRSLPPPYSLGKSP